MNNRGCSYPLEELFTSFFGICFTIIFFIIVAEVCLKIFFGILSIFVIIKIISLIIKKIRK